MKGLIHVYKGEGKGKTTACVGLTVRAAGRGKNVIFLQFHKGNETGEINILNNLSNVTVIRNTKNFGFYNTLSIGEQEELINMQNNNFDRALSIIKDGKTDMLVMDEIFTACCYKTIDVEKLKNFLVNKPKELEVVMNGHNPDSFFCDIADYVTDMRCEKHPYEKGICARVGIEM